MFRPVALLAALVFATGCPPPKRTLINEADPAAPEDVAKPPFEVEYTDSGLATRVLREGKGDEHPAPEDRVVVHYTGWTTDGRRFDSTQRTGKPATLGLAQTIPGWREGLQLMVVGEKRRMWIPQWLAYRGARGKPPGMLVFDVELLEIQKAESDEAE